MGDSHVLRFSVRGSCDCGREAYPSSRRPRESILYFKRNDCRFAAESPEVQSEQLIFFLFDS